MTRNLAALIVTCGITCGVALASSVALSQSEWPSKPVRIIVPYAAGGAADALGRVFGEALSTTLGKQFFVENRPGGGSLLGSEMVARAEPDGYTFTLSGMSTHVVATAMNKNAGFDPVRDFTHLR